MSVSNIGGHGVSGSLPSPSDASLAMPVEPFPSTGDTDPQAIMNLKTQPNLSGVQV